MFEVIIIYFKLGLFSKYYYSCLHFVQDMNCSLQIFFFLFQINVEAKEFSGLSRVKQHRLVTESLKSEIAEMHGIRINTTVPTAGDK